MNCPICDNSASLILRSPDLGVSNQLYFVLRRVKGAGDTMNLNLDIDIEDQEPVNIPRLTFSNLFLIAFQLQSNTALGTQLNDHKIE